MNIVERVKFALKPWIEDNVYVQYVAFSLLYHCRFLLPHDADFYGVAHLPLNVDSDGILDVGGNMGLAALSLRRLAPALKVFSIEPNPIHAERLHGIQQRDPMFRYAMVGAGRAAGQATLHVPYYHHVPLHTMAAVDRETLVASCLSLYGKRARHIHIKTVSINIIPIDDLGMSPSLIKIDAEGFEEAIIEGAMRTIEKFRPFLLIENNPGSMPAIVARLERLGYGCYRWDRGARAFSAAPAPTRNVYLLPREQSFPVARRPVGRVRPVLESTPPCRSL